MVSGGQTEASYILSLDQGTTSSRAILFTHAGTIAGVAQMEFEQIFPQPGWVEHDAEEIWHTQIKVARDVLKETGVAADQIAAIGITNQRETTVIWDKRTGKPIHNAIVWQDRRTASYCEDLKAQGLEGEVRSRTGLFLDPYFSGTKLKWLLDNVHGARDLAEKGHLAFGTIDTWLVWNLTTGARHVTDSSNASRTLLFNIEDLSWDDEQLDLLDIPAGVLPEIVPSSGVAGRTAPDLFGIEIPIAGIAGDQQAALFGQRCVAPGMAKNTYGTGCFLLMNTGDQIVTSEHKLVSTVAWTIGDRTSYAIEGSIFIGGAVVQWLRDGLGIIESSGAVESLARSISSTDGVYLVPAFSGLGAPHWDPHARGAILGITRGTTSAHIARAAIEGIAFQVDDVLQAMQGDSRIELAELRVDGGASANDLLLEFQSGLLGVPVLRPDVLETTALGAAYLAGLAVGFWSSQDELDSHWNLEKKFTPEMEASEVDRLKSGWNLALGRSKEWSNNL